MQAQLAEKLGIDFTTLSRIENGWLAGWKHHVALAKIFGLTDDYFEQKLRELGLPQSLSEMRQSDWKKRKKKRGRVA